MNSGTRNIEITGINPAEFFGVNNSNLRHLKTFFPKLKIVSRGNLLSLNGDEEIMDEFERKLDLLDANARYLPAGTPRHGAAWVNAGGARNGVAAGETGSGGA